MTAFQTLFQNRLDVIDAVATGAATVDELPAPFVGPDDFERIDYPYLQILPESTDDQGANEWSHTIRLNSIFELKRDRDYTTLLAVALEAATAALTELSTLDCVRTYRPERIEDFANAEANDLLIMISVQLRVTVSVDLANS